MSWFAFALICLLGWGFADLFYRLGTDENDRYSHIKIGVWVGLVMGVAALIMLPFSESFAPGKGKGIGEFLLSAVKYSPASLCYIISMVIGYAGLRYLETSIVSPVQNASGAFSAIAMFVWYSVMVKGTTLVINRPAKLDDVWFLVTGTRGSVYVEFSVLDIIGTILIVAGVIALGIVENRLSKNELKKEKDSKKYRYGALALLFPILYCIFDTIGTAADGIILDEKTGLGLGEIDVLILYGLTFLLAGIGGYLFLRFKTGKWYNPFQASEKYKVIAALCEEAGQIFYVFAMAKNPVIAAPMVASYCIVSVLLARLVVKEKLNLWQYLCVLVVILGIVLLGISEGLGEKEEAVEETAQETASMFEQIRMQLATLSDDTALMV